MHVLATPGLHHSTLLAELGSSAGIQCWDPVLGSSGEELHTTDQDNDQDDKEDRGCVCVGERGCVCRRERVCACVCLLERGCVCLWRSVRDCVHACICGCVCESGCNLLGCQSVPSVQSVHGLVHHQQSHPGPPLHLHLQSDDPPWRGGVHGGTDLRPNQSAFSRLLW